MPNMCVGQRITQHLEQPGLGSRCLGSGGRPGLQEGAVHLVEKQTGGKQVLWLVPDAELKAESPGGLGTALPGEP